MKNFIYLFSFTILLTVVASDSCYAQYGFSFNKDSIRAEGPNTEFDVYDYKGVTFRNDSAGTNEFVWVRTVKLLPGLQWESAVCDINLCHPAETETATFQLNEGDSGVFSIHFYPSTGSGTAYVTIEVYPLNDSTKKVMTHAKAVVWDGINSLSNIEYNKLGLYPNPSVDGKFFLSKEFSKDVSIEVLDLSGKIIQTLSLFPGEKIVDLSSLNAGTYIIRVYAEDEQYYSRITKY